MSDKPSVEERYLAATMTSDLRVMAEQATDADKLLAAAYAVAGDPRKNLALKVWRLRATGDMAGAHQLAEELGAKMRKRSMGKGGGSKFLRGTGGQTQLTRRKATDVSMMVLKWWQRPTCPFCNGLCHPMMAGGPVLDTSRDCEHCHGTGLIPVEKLVHKEHVEAAKWLISEMEGLCGFIFGDMAVLLRQSLD